MQFFVGLNTGYVKDNVPDQRYLEFYKRRSSEMLHCAIVGNVVIPGGTGSNDNTPVITADPVWEDVARSISEKGTLPGIQLSTAWPGYVGMRGFRSKQPKAAIDECRALINGMSTDQIKSRFDELVRGADIAIEAGFKHIQLHAAHGYLFSLLIDPSINRHAENAIDMAGDWASRLQSAGIESSIRISMRTGLPSLDGSSRDYLIDRISNLPFSYIDLSSGFYNIDKKLIYPGRPEIVRQRKADTIAIAKRNPERQYIYSGKALSQSEPNLPANVHIGLCRDLIANPDFLKDDRWGCINSGRCHYYSRGEPHITCRQWDKTN